METAKKTGKRRMPAEWERQSAVQLTWPHKDTDWRDMLPEITTVYEQMAYEISKREQLIKVDFIPTNDTWARDHGFITVEEDGQLRLLDFKFNGWGESDGRGTIFTTSCCLLAPHRNQPLTQQEIEKKLKEWLGAERIVWINHGSLIGDDTDGHIDTLVRICPNDTLLFIAADDDHADLVQMELELQTLRTTEGKPYRLLKLPMPRPIYDGEDRLPATYANYLVINDAVLVPTYAQPDLDAEAMRIIGTAFPDREIIGIDCQAVIRQHGSLHCCTMQYY